MFANRLDGIKPSGIRKMFEMAAKDSIQLGLGEPDFNPPEVAIEAVKRAMDAGENGYGSIYGLPELREAVAEYCQRYDDSITSENVVITVGGSEALKATAFTFYNPGDEVLYPDPGFVLYEPHAQLHGAKPVPYPLLKENHFRPRQEDLEKLITPRTKALIVNSPSNPCGSVFSEEDVKMIVDMATDNNLVLISDEVYDRIVYDDVHRSFLGRYENTVFINSFSKTLAMTGWRIGYFVARKEMVRKIGLSHYYTVACPATPLQHGVLAALRDGPGFTDRMVAEFRKRREIIVSEVNKIDGLHCLMPEGAFYVLPTFDFDIDDVELVTRMVKAGVICTPGSAFGENGAGHIRFSYANSEENIRKGLGIVRDVLGQL